MPKVGKMKFPYTGQGIKEAANYAKNSGKPMQVEGNYRHGGMVPNRPNPMGGGLAQPPLERYTPRTYPGSAGGTYLGNPNSGYGPHRGAPIPPSVGVPGTSPLPPGAGIRPPVNPGIYRNGGMVTNKPNPMGGRMNPRMKKELMKRLAKFKKGIV